MNAWRWCAETVRPAPRRRDHAKGPTHRCHRAARPRRGGLRREPAHGHTHHPAPVASASATATPRPEGQSVPPSTKDISALPGTLYYSYLSNGRSAVRRFRSGHSLEDFAPALGDGHVVRVAPDGRRIAFTDGSSGAVAIANPDGSGKRVLPGTEGAGMLDWSPDSTRIVYRRQISPRQNVIEMVDAGTSTVRKLGGDGDFPTWSPDGGHVVFASGRDEHLWKSLTVVEVGGSTSRTVPVTAGSAAGRVAQVASVSPGAREVAVYLFCTGCDIDNGADRWFHATALVDTATGTTEATDTVVLWTADGRTLTRVTAGGGTVLELRGVGGTVVARQAEPTGDLTLTGYVP
ncbi:hypothetical protein F4553_006923 [Allocatelliglobosispora scoriae]|uniref:Dipeptidylpeptidase IV N-terminal domain-containing protein n=1 Tax=Allocatelliglobosispora scoriae TaxID=643052 RepID=A0A841C2G0_9ACTN|nr:PD40 domain-containing protein [Allocatelliglobosispora scoriae]MBB5873489.1 hypothetical protein [Allocatelliglobosispora scoriae]